MTNSESQAADQSDAFRLLLWWASIDAVEKRLVVDIRDKGRAFVENALQFTDEYVDLATRLSAKGSAVAVTPDASTAKGKWRKTKKYGPTTDSRDRWSVEDCKVMFKMMLRANPKQLANIADFCRHVATSLPGNRTGASIRGQYDQHFVHLAGQTDKPMPPIKKYAVEAFRLAKEEIANEESQLKASPKQQPELPLRVWLEPATATGSDV